MKFDLLTNISQNQFVDVLREFSPVADYETCLRPLSTLQKSKISKFFFLYNGILERVSRQVSIHIRVYLSFSLMMSSIVYMISEKLEFLFGFWLVFVKEKSRSSHCVKSLVESFESSKST